MTATQLQHPQSPAAPSRQATKPPPRRNRGQRGMTPAQRVVVTLASLPLIGIALTSAAGAIGLISVEDMLDLALALGEEPGMFVFAAMLWCSPVQRFVNRTQVPVRKTLGVMFSFYAMANFAMFVIERDLASSISAPFLIAGTAAMALSLPLLATSGRWAQRTLGMRNWRVLHKLTYVIAIALVLHLALVGEFSLSLPFIVVALIARIPPFARALSNRGRARRHRLQGSSFTPVA